MRLRAIDLHGYKSFAARTSLQFDTPVTAIVGPNGSGKSNVMDALRWAIGAGTGRSLRTKRAEDVVFSGGRDRAPSGLAEVRVQLDNSDRWLDLDAAEIEVVRRVHRDGQSEVRLNGRAARLRDIQDLFRSSGLGAGGFALMSQGLVDEMLRLRPHERRQAIEEVGGVRQHRHEMEESRRRRERAQEHLERARLVRDELAPRLRSLERSARRARRSIELRRELEQAQRRYFAAAASEIERELVHRREAAVSASAARVNAEARREAATNALAAVERDTGNARSALESAAARLRSARAELRTLEHEQELDQQQRSWVTRQISDLSARAPLDDHEAPVFDLAKSRQQLDEADKRLKRARHEHREREQTRAGTSALLERSISDLEHVRKRGRILARRWSASAVELLQLDRDATAAELRHNSATDRYSLAERELERLRLALTTAREERTAHTAAERRLQHRLAEVQRERDAIERQRPTDDQLRSLVLDVVDDPVRAEAIFGELMDATLHDELGDAIQAVQRIIDADAGRSAAVQRSRADELIASVLAGYEAVDDVDSAIRAASNGRPGVTRDGIVIRPDGLVLGGSQAGANRRRQRMNELDQEHDDLSAQIDELTNERTADAQLSELSDAVSTAESSVEHARQAASAERRALDRVRRRRDAATASRQADRAEIARLREQLQTARSAHRQASEELRASPNPPTADLSTLETARDQAASALADARAQAAASERLQSDRARLTSLRRELEQIEHAIRSREPLLSAAMTTAEHQDDHEQANAELASLERRRSLAADELSEAQRRRLHAERADVEAAAALREHEAAHARLAAEAAAEGIDLHGVLTTAQATLELNGANGSNASAISDRNGSAVRSHPTGPTAVAVAERSVSALQEDMRQLRVKLERLGPVDPGSAEEYAAEQTRWRQMEQQIADLQATEDSLRIAERDLERLIEQKFRDACQQVDEAFRRYFQLMFRGGRAELVLTDERPAAETETEPEDAWSPPRSGVDIRAQPPGKRVSALGLLSGGERALTAIALLFALLEVRPAPFCILDEVDAALDEANVERFVSALKERARETQFVVITHNRRTIEQADSIYGVTMGAAGVSRLLSVRMDEIPQPNS